MARRQFLQRRQFGRLAETNLPPMISNSLARFSSKPIISAMRVVKTVKPPETSAA